MSTPKCAATVFGVALAVGTLIGGAFVFFVTLAEFRALPSALPDVESWLGSVGVASIAAAGGAVVGAITGAAAWSVAALALLLFPRRQRVIAVRVCTVGIGSAIGAALVLWFFATRPGLIIGVDIIAVSSVAAAALAVAALLVSERVGQREMAVGRPARCAPASLV